MWFILQPMRAVVESRSAGCGLWIAVVAGLVAGAGACRGADAAYLPGASEASRGASSADSGVPDVPGEWEHKGALAGLQVLASDFPSRGHGTGEYVAQLRGNTQAASSVDGLTPGKQMPIGAMLVQLHRQRTGGSPEAMYVMEKKEAGYFPEGGDWDYALVRPDGTIVARGKLAACARCHAEAAVDFVFPRPR